MSWLSSMVSSWTGSNRRRQDLLDLLIMVALADESLSQRDLDRIARAVETRPELDGVSWSEVMSRAATLAREAPGFSDTRHRIKHSLRSGDHRRFALSLAAHVLDVHMSDEERFFLHGLAEDLEIPPDERDQLLAPWAGVDPFSLGYVRCNYNDPERAREQSIFDAMAHAESDIELALLTFKLSAVRGAINHLSESTRISSIGELVELRQGRFRVDALLRHGDRNWIARFLSRGEALHPKELELLPAVFEKLDASVKLLVGFVDRLSPQDGHALSTLESSRVELVALVP